MMQVIQVLKEVVDKHGYVSGVTNLIGNMLIKPAHITSDADVSHAMHIHSALQEGADCHVCCQADMLCSYHCPTKKFMNALKKHSRRGPGGKA